MMHRVGRKASAARAQIVVSGSADVGIDGEQIKSVGDGVDYAPGGFQTAAFPGNVIGDIFQVRLGASAEVVCHLAGRFMLRGQAGADAFQDASVSLRGDWRVISVPSPWASEVSASSSVSRNSARVHSRSSQSPRASFTASSGRSNRAASTAWRISAS